MAVPQILTAVEYNRIRTFEEQQSTQLPNHILQAIARLFIASGIEHDYGLGILHRHFEIPSETILLHCTQDLVRSCVIRNSSELPRASVRAHSLYLNEAHDFQAFEYDLDSTRQQLSAEFLHELRALFLQHDLANFLAVIPNLHAAEELFEFQLADNSGMITIPKSMVEAADMQETIQTTTGWAFFPEEGGVQIRAVQKCIPQTSGFHKKAN